MSCPKCHAEMRSYERNGIHIDQCTECRGIFLDRGELEHLVTAEAQWSAPAPAAQPAAGYAPPPAYAPAPAYAPQPAYAPGYDPRYSKGKRRKSFLEELFD